MATSKRKVFSIVVSLTFVGAFFSAPAVWAAPNCAQVKAAVLSEEMIGFKAWQKFDDYRNKIPRAMQVQHIRKYVALIAPVHQSDMRVFQLVKKSPTCFTSKVIDLVAKQDPETKKISETFKTLVASVKDLPGNLPAPNADKLYLALRDYYNEFWEIIEYKRISKAAPTPKNTSKPKSDISLGV